MNDAPLISICIPAYKGEKYLDETLSSIRTQTYTNWELIVTEDGSKDGTELIVRTFAAKVSQPVRYERHEVNQGLPATRNTGFACARGDLIAILDADDLWLPTHLEKALAVLQNGHDISYSGCVIFDSDTGTELETRALNPVAQETLPLALLEGRLVIQPSTVVFRRELLGTSVAFNKSFPICNDLEFWLNNARLGRRFGATSTLTCRYRKHSAALSKNAAAMMEEVTRLHRNYRDWPGQSKALRRRLSLRSHVNTARMYARNRPFHALSLLLRGASDFLGPRN